MVTVAGQHSCREWCGHHDLRGLFCLRVLEAIHTSLALRSKEMPHHKPLAGECRNDQIPITAHGPW